jgi:hypothetical protein
MNTASKCLLISILVALTFAINGYCQGPVPQHAEDDGTLLGHALKDEDTFKNGVDIIIGKFVSLGTGSSDSPGESYYQGASIQVISSLKGSLSGNLKASFSVKFFSQHGNETVPVVGNQYIMFLRERVPNEFTIKKLLLATDKNIAEVKTAIAAAPAGKYLSR